MSLQVQSLGGSSAVRYSRWPLSNLFSLRYFVLRSFTAGGAVVNGLVQTFVFARVLTPQNFSVYILIGSLGVALWLFDLGAARILFVRQRHRHLTKQTDDAVPAQSNAVILLYALLVLLGTIICFAVMASRSSVTPVEAVHYGAFFTFTALNLVWFPLRNVSSAVDEFIAFEALELLRRVGHIGLTLSLLLGLPLLSFLLLANLLWAVVFTAAISRLIRKGALARDLSGCWHALAMFWNGNRREILRSANYAVGELAVYNFPYYFVPMAFGLGAPTIILDTVFKIFRGATLVYAAGLDPLVPRQTRAFAENDLVALKRATWTAAFLCAIPTLVLCALLLFVGDRFFALLLGHAATMPRAATAILVVLLIGNLAHSVASCLLLFTGFFREMARVARFVVIAMAAMTGIVVGVGADIIGFMGGYAAIYVVGAALYVSYAQQKIFANGRRAAQPMSASS